jgi:hypothetical protein
MTRIRAAVALGLTLAPALMFAAACSRPPEQQLLTQFFRAARNRDNNTTAMMSAVPLDPREQGSVESFSITTIGPEQRAPLAVKAAMAAESKAREAEAEFRKTKIEYQNANIKILEQLIKLEGNPAAKLTPEQEKVKTEWAKWTEDTRAFARAVADARRAVAVSTGTVEASLTQPNQPAFDAKSFDGEMVRKDVTIAADWKDPAGAVSQKAVTVTFERASGTQGGARREGRWIITRIAGV